ncbi:hypothetical protein SAMN04487974_105171 [Pelagibacterium luteolum]|uniref:Uncharacterized protein n=1 Tax=Pelagibacterium luteolum TaxID=440168 RepID=A0A1G7W2H2_9HYPH|nr:hypothetical protein SAMN04487974_105171 [Pelagibacterium luteolum]
MRERDYRSAAYRRAQNSHEPIRWVQAGLKSSAYRLAHLSVPRMFVLPLLSLVFFIA